MKKAYQIPTIEITTLTTQWILAWPPSHGAPGAPAHHGDGGGGDTSNPF